MKRVKCSIFVSTILCTSSLVGANIPQQVLDQAIQQGSQNQRNQQIQQDNQLKRDLKEPKDKSTIDIESDSPYISKTNSAVKFIKEIKISGSTLLSEQTLAPILSKYSNKDIGIQDIQLLMGELTMEYMKMGYSTTRVYIPAQDLNSGILKLNIVEGLIEKIDVQDNEEGKSVSVGNIFPNMVGEPLNIYDIEQGIDQLNRLSSNKAKMEIAPSSKDGQSIIVVKNETTKPWAASINSDNTGNESTGRWQNGLTLSYDNLAGYDDFITVSAKRTLPTYNDKSSESRSITYSVPVGYTTLSLNVNHSDFNNIIIADSGDINIDSKTNGVSFIIDHVLSRGQNYKVTASTSLNKKSTEFNILDEKVAVASPILSIWDVDLKGFYSFANGVIFNWSMGHSQGLSSFGAQKDDSEIEADQAHAQFSKIRYGAGISKNILLSDSSSLDFSSQLNGMKTNDALYGTEQFTVTGTTGVRGFYETALAGHKGYNVRNDIKWNIPTEILNLPIKTSLYYGYDFGELMSFQESQKQSVGGNAIGVGINYKNLEASLEYSEQLWKPESIKDESGITTFKLSINF